MANYYIDEASSQLTIGAISGVEEPAGQVRNIVLTNVNPNDNSWNGLTIQAKNFKIKNGHLVVPVSNETYIWNDSTSIWDADDKINQVVFTNLGAIGTQDNKVNMAITFNAFTPTDSVSVNINLEESDDPITQASHEFSFPISWTSNNNHTVTTSSDYTKTVDSATEHTFSGNVLSNIATVIATVNFDADPNYYYDENNIHAQVDGVLGLYLYSHEIVEQVYTDSLLTGFTVRYEFNWNTLASTNSDWADVYTGNINAFGPLDSEITYTIHQEAVASTENRIHSVSYPPSLTSSQGEIPIRVFGSANAPYKLSIEKKTSTTSTVTAASNGYYNFDTRAFQTAVTSLSSTCDAKGVNVNYVLLPDASSDTRYDITVSGVVAGSTTVLNSNVPQKAGDATIIKNGVNTITIKPVTYNPARYHTDVANGILNLSVSKSSIAAGSGPGRAKPTSVIFKGGTGGSVSTRLVLEDNPSGVFAGMVITGSGIKHGTTVTAISKNVVTLSQSCTVAAATDIKFTTNTANLFPFSFLIARNGASDVISITSGADLKGAVGGLTSVKTNITSPSTKSTSQAVANTRGIVSGMTITGTEVKTVAGEKLTVNAAPTSLTAITFSGTQSFSNGASLRFSGGNASADVSLHSIQANMSGTSVWITGYLEINEIKATADVAIYIDDIISYP